MPSFPNLLASGFGMVFGLVVLVVIAVVGGTFGLILVVAGFVGIIGLRFFVGLVRIVGIVMVGFVRTGAGLFADLFPVPSVNRMGQDSHLVKCVRFTLLTHDIFDMISQTTIVAVSENGVVPAGLCG